MIRCVRFRPYEKNTLRGFCDLELTRVGLVLRDCCWHVHANGREWVSFPAKPFETKSGETAWQPIIEFADGATQAREQFQAQALEAIHQAVAEQKRREAS
jgi:hypothetical protein